MKPIKNPLPRLDVFCSRDDLRPVMNCILIDQHHAVASDTHILIKINVSERFENIEKMDGKMIHRAVWFQMLWANRRVCTDTGIQCFYDNFKCTYEYNTNGNYPNYMTILKEAYNNSKKSTELVRFALMPFIMAKFANLDSHKPVKFYTITENQNIFIQSENYHGIIMPCMNGLGLEDLKHLFV
jgi:hypothetical protein